MAVNLADPKPYFIYRHVFIQFLTSCVIILTSVTFPMTENISFITYSEVLLLKFPTYLNTYVSASWKVKNQLGQTK